MSTTSTRAVPSLPTFHVLPPRKLTIELPAAEHDRLEAYADFYNRSSGAKEDAASVAAAMVQHFMSRDRNFKRWEVSAEAKPPATAGGADA